jgi:hypothetical protein
MTYRFEAPLWKYSGESAWYFITLPFDVADEIDEVAASSKRGFGSVRVEATIGSSTWNTSLFPDSKAKSFLLPVKKQVRLGENLQPEVPVAVALRLVEG